MAALGDVRIGSLTGKDSEVNKANELGRMDSAGRALNGLPAARSYSERLAESVPVDFRRTPERARRLNVVVNNETKGE